MRNDLVFHVGADNPYPYGREEVGCVIAAKLVACEMPAAFPAPL